MHSSESCTHFIHIYYHILITKLKQYITSRGQLDIIVAQSYVDKSVLKGGSKVLGNFYKFSHKNRQEIRLIVRNI